MNCQTINLLRAGALLLALLACQASAQSTENARAQDYDSEAALKRSQAAIGNTLHDAQLVDINGHAVNLTDFSGKPLLISLVFTSCYHTCPVTTRYLAKAVANAREVLGKDSFNIVTIGFDTLHDTPDSMAAFAKSQAIDTSNWAFLSGTAESMASLVKDLGFIYFPSPRGFDHIVQLTVVDRDSRVYRQVYGEAFDLPWLMEPLKDLVFNRPSSTDATLASLTDRIKLFCTVYDPTTGRYKFDYSLFFQIAIGFMIVASVSIYLLREVRRSRRRH
ncbi:MAG: SCO family protein [Gammaproteobacteria bacterium]|nr:SCO family protein [Gammaproteobacteria bacterium]